MNNNQIINNGLEAVNKACKTLSEKELTIIGFYHDSLSKPTIEIEHHPFCKKMIDQGAAVYFMHQHYKRWGQFELDGCRIVWKERDTSRLH